jgi:prolyl oligopeptidase
MPHRIQNPNHRFGCCLAALLLALVPGAGAQQRTAYPAATRGAVADDYFGTSVADPYRWLEDLDSPATRAWVAAEAKLTESFLASYPVRHRIRARLATLYDFEKIGTPFEEGGRYFYSHNSGLQNQSVLFTVKDLGKRAAVALDPNILSADGSLAVVGYVASEAGGLLAYGISVSGSDWTEWHLRDLSTGKDRPDVIRYMKYYEPVFSHDGKGLYYSVFPAPRPGEELTAPDVGNALYYHLIGSPASTDRRVFEDRAHPSWQFEPHLSADGHWLVIAAGDGEVGDKGLENIYLLDASAANARVRPVAVGFDAAYLYVGADADAVFFLTTLGAARGKVIAVDPKSPERKHWKTVIAEGRDAIDLTEPSVTLVDHQFIVRTVHDARSQVKTYGLDGALQRDVTLPGPGTARGFGGHPNYRETFYTFTDLITAPTV